MGKEITFTLEFPRSVRHSVLTLSMCQRLTGGRAAHFIETGELVRGKKKEKRVTAPPRSHGETKGGNLIIQGFLSLKVRSWCWS